jgi:hypothetical protein
VTFVVPRKGRALVWSRPISVELHASLLKVLWSDQRLAEEQREKKGD